MVAAESTFEIPQDQAFLVSQRKYNLDPSRPWWAKAYFRFIFLPLVRFSFKRMQVPAVGAIEPDGRIVIIEQQGIYLDEDTAKDACRDEFWNVKPILLNTDLPRESVQFKGHSLPRSIMPDRYKRRSFPGIAIGTHRQVTELTETLQAISRAATGQK